MALCVPLASCGGMRHIAGTRSLRGPQPSLSELEWAIAEHGVRTVISLRAPRTGDPAYEAQVATCERAGVRHVALDWSARATSDDKVDALVAILRDAEGPVFLHCRNGHDRSSLAAAIYRRVVLDHDADAAAEELDFVPHGHLPLFGYEAMDEAWRRFLAREHREEREQREQPSAR